MKHFLALAALLLGCAQPVTVPEVGDTFPISRGAVEMMTASADAWPYQQITVSGLSYGVAVNKQSGKVAYVDIRDPKFKTPEGLSVGSTLEQVLATGAKAPWGEPGWAYHTQLPSGWSAAFVVGRGMADGPLQPTSKVSWFFKRK